MVQRLSARIAARFGLSRDASPTVHWPIALWALAIAAYGIGDAATTVYLVTTTPLVEGNPLLAPLVEHVGVWVVVPLKGVALVAFYALACVIPPEWRIGVPAGVAVVGVVVTIWNVAVGIPLV